MQLQDQLHFPCDRCRLPFSRWGQENRTDFDHPEEPLLRLRYLAKLAICGGASLLMACVEFRSYRSADVIPKLSREFPRWAAFLEETSGLKVHPISTAAARLPDYLPRLVGRMDWIGAEPGLENAV
jgi:hypothetical protein